MLREVEADVDSEFRDVDADVDCELRDAESVLPDSVSACCAVVSELREDDSEPALRDPFDLRPLDPGCRRRSMTVVVTVFLYRLTGGFFPPPPALLLAALDSEDIPDPEAADIELSDADDEDIPDPDGADI